MQADFISSLIMIERICTAMGLVARNGLAVRSPRRKGEQHSRCRAWYFLLAFVALASCLFLLDDANAAKAATLRLILGTKRLEKQEETVGLMDERDKVKCDHGLNRLVEENIRLVAIDFDLTIVDIHTGGNWKFGSESLLSHVRPEFQCLIRRCLEHDIHVAVATFSRQIKLLNEVLHMAIPIIAVDDKDGDDPSVPIFGGDAYVENHEEGKQSQLLLAMNFFNEQEMRRSPELPSSQGISPATMVLIDDDGLNIEIARRDGYHTLHYDPDHSQSEDALIFQKRAKLVYF